MHYKFSMELGFRAVCVYHKPHTADNAVSDQYFQRHCKTRLRMCKRKFDLSKHHQALQLPNCVTKKRCRAYNTSNGKCRIC
jgi:hypothetical protein